MANTNTVCVHFPAGGACKSSTAVNFASIAASRGLRVCLVDCDNQLTSSNVVLSALPEKTVFELVTEDIAFGDVVVETTEEFPESLFSISGSPKLSALEASNDIDKFYVLDDKLKANSMDLVVIDSPPAGQSVATIMSLVAAKWVVTPIACEPKVWEQAATWERSFKSASRLNSELEWACVVPSKLGSRINLDAEVYEEMRSRYEQMITPPVRASVKVRELLAIGKPPFKLPFDDFEIVTNHILTRIGVLDGEEKVLTKPKASQKLESVPIVQGPVRDEKAILLPLSILKADPADNPRKDLGDLSELAASISENGVLQNILVKKGKSGGLRVCGGFRRYHAAKLAGLDVIPCRIVEGDAHVATAIENIQRKSLEPLEEVFAISSLTQTFSSQVDLAKAIGKSKSYVTKCLKAVDFVRKNPKVSDQKLSREMLFNLAYAKDPLKAIEDVANGAVSSSKDFTFSGRQPSGPVPGGRSTGEKVFQYKPRRKGKAFSLRINVDLEKTPKDDRKRVIEELKKIIEKLEEE